MRSSLLIPLLFAALLGGCAGNLPIVGLDGSGRPVEARVSEAKYVERMTGALKAVCDSTLPALGRESGRAGDWELGDVGVGFAVRAEAGIGPFKVGIRPSVRVVFSNHGAPPPP